MTANRSQRTACCPFTQFFTTEHVKHSGLIFSADHTSDLHSGVGRGKPTHLSQLQTITLIDGQVQRNEDCTDHCRLHPTSLCIWKPGNRAVHYAVPQWNNCCSCRVLTGTMLGWPQITAGTKVEKRVLSSSHKLIHSTCYLFIWQKQAAAGMWYSTWSYFISSLLHSDTIKKTSLTSSFIKIFSHCGKSHLTPDKPN